MLTQKEKTNSPSSAFTSNSAVSILSVTLARGVQSFGVSGPHWKKRSCLGLHIKYTNTNEN